MKRTQKLADLFKEKEVKTMTTLRKPVALIGKMAAVPALFLLMLFTVCQTVYAEDYNLYIGSTRVTSENCGNIFGALGTNGEPTAKYDAGTKTLYLNGVHIDKDHYHEVEQYSGYSPLYLVSRYSMFADTDVVRKLVISGDNSFVSAGSEVLHIYDAEWDSNDMEVDKNEDGLITKEDMITDVIKADGSGICFSATGNSGTEAFTITGTGTLTSTSTEGTAYDYDYYGSDGDDFGTPDEKGRTNKRPVNIGTAMTVKGGGWIYMGNEDGTGPTLELTGWDIGADFGSCRRFAMQGGTIIAKATSSTMGTGVYLSSGSDFFEGGTIAGYGILSGDKGGSFADANDAMFDTTISKTHGMQRVYPETVDNDETDIHDATRPVKIRALSGWCVVGMTADTFKESTDTVLQELGLDSGGGGTDPVDPDNPGGGGTDPVNPDNPGTGEGNHYHTDTLPDSGVDIDVQGFTKAGTVYSVDVEWGAMTFQYEKTTWNAETHKTEPGRGWLVYDNVTEKVINSTQDTINHITVTNHSNADVFATLSYTGIDGYTDITGDFTKKTDDADTNLTAAADTTPAYLTLGTADNKKGAEDGQGKETVGTVYFMPSGIGKTGDVVNEISQWTKIGKITIGILTETP